MLTWRVAGALQMLLGTGEIVCLLPGLRSKDRHLDPQRWFLWWDCLFLMPCEIDGAFSLGCVPPQQLR